MQTRLSTSRGVADVSYFIPHSMLLPSRAVGISEATGSPPDGLVGMEGKIRLLAPAFVKLSNMIWILDGSRAWTWCMLLPPELLLLLLKTTTATAAMTADPATDATVATMITTELVEEEEELPGEGDGDGVAEIEDVAEGELASEDIAFIPAAGGTCGDEGGKGVTLPDATI